MARLTYKIGEPSVVVGQRVVISLGSKRRVIAIVAKVEVDAPPKAESIKWIEEVIEGVALIGDKELELVQWAADYYMCKVGDVLRMGYSPLFSTEIEGQNSRLLKTKKKKKSSIVEKLLPPPLQYNLPNDRSITLLHSFEELNIASLVASIHKEGRVTLVLAPTPQAATRIEESLKLYYRTVLCTNTTSVKRRARLLIDMSVGLAPEVVVGTRTALWLNYKSLGAVVITSEESYHYRTAREPYISARECALVLASLYGVRTIVCSSFPSVESYYNAKYGQWGYIATEKRREGFRSIVLERGREDMVSKYTKERAKEVLETAGKIVILQNRRGVASYVECQRCGYIPQCPNCSTSLTLHSELLGCHYCGSRSEVLTECSQCGANAMVNRGRGTQQIEAQLLSYFPDARVKRLDSDSFADVGSRSRALIKGEDNSWDIIIGTTMVLDANIWQGVGLIVVLNFDNMVSAANFRVEEEAYRTLGLLAGRAVEQGAELVIQSSKRTHRSIVAVLDNQNDSDGKSSAEKFYHDEIIGRKASNFPPHSRMIRIELRGDNFDNVVRLGTDVEDALRVVFQHRISPIYQPVVERQRGEYIVEMLLKIERGRSSARAKKVVSGVLEKARKVATKQRITISVEVDPM